MNSFSIIVWNAISFGVRPFSPNDRLTICLPVETQHDMGGSPGTCPPPHCCGFIHDCCFKDWVELSRKTGEVCQVQRFLSPQSLKYLSSKS